MKVPVLYRASFGFLKRHSWQLAMALAGVSIGVAVMVAVDLANESARRAFLLSMDAVTGEATHQIVGPSGVDERLYTRLRIEEGFRNIAPIVEDYAVFDNSTLHLLGVDMLADRDIRRYTDPGADELVVAAEPGANSDSLAAAEDLLRQMLTEPDTVILSGMSAAAAGVAAGDDILLHVHGKPVTARIIALVGAADDSRFANILITDIANAQHWLGAEGTLSRIDVRLVADGQADSVRAMTERLQAALPPGVTLLPAAGRTEAVTEMSSAFMTNLTAMSLLALLIGVFLIYNSISFSVLQRRAFIGTLRALGLTRSETVTLILVEALLVGLAGAVLGLALGLWLGERLLLLVSRSINDLYFIVNVTEVAVAPGSLLKGMVAGLAATTAAAALPALEASSWQPRLALARSVLEYRSGRLAPRLALAGVAAACLAVVLLEVSGTSLVAGLIAIFMLILGLAFCIPLAVRLLARVAAPLAATLGGTVFRHAVAGVGASLSRTGVAIVALAVAVSATIGVTVMVDSFRSSVGAWVDATLQADIYVSVAQGSLDAQLVDDLLRHPDIAAHSSSRRVWLESVAGRTRLTALDMAPGSYAGIYFESGDPETIWQEFQDGAVLVSGSYAWRHDRGSGDSLLLQTSEGERRFRIAGVYRTFDADLDAVLIGRGAYDAFWDDQAVDALGIYLREGADAAEVLRDFRRISADRQALMLNSNRALRERSMQIFDRTFVITDVLYWLAVAVASLGILGAMLALQLERAREYAVFRALGMTPAQLGGMVLLQSGVIGLLSGLAAIPLGTVMAWVLVHVINRRAFGWQMDIVFSPSLVLLALLLATGAAVIAGIYPAWRAASRSPALAMREE